MTNVNLDSFSHGQIKSKLWLCEYLEPYIPKNATLLILGSWVNVTGFMLLTRRPNHYSHVRGIDIDESTVEIANKICSYWYIEGIQRSTVDDANKIDMRGFNTVINCSSEHMEGMQWFNNIPSGTTVCIQSSNIVDPSEPWLVTNPSATFDIFMEKYPLTDIKFAGTLPIRYKDWGYDRYMIIGIK
jgi:hypothetical protein